MADVPAVGDSQALLQQHVEQSAVELAASVWALDTAQHKYLVPPHLTTSPQPLRLSSLVQLALQVGPELLLHCSTDGRSATLLDALQEWPEIHKAYQQCLAYQTAVRTVRAQQARHLSQVRCGMVRHMAHAIEQAPVLGSVLWQLTTETNNKKWSCLRDLVKNSHGLALSQSVIGKDNNKVVKWPIIRKEWHIIEARLKALEQHAEQHLRDPDLARKILTSLGDKQRWDADTRCWCWVEGGQQVGPYSARDLQDYDALRMVFHRLEPSRHVLLQDIRDYLEGPPPDAGPPPDPQVVAWAAYCKAITAHQSAAQHAALRGDPQHAPQRQLPAASTATDATEPDVNGDGGSALPAVSPHKTRRWLWQGEGSVVPWPDADKERMRTLDDKATALLCKQLSQAVRPMILRPLIVHGPKHRGMLQDLFDGWCDQWQNRQAASAAGQQQAAPLTGPEPPAGAQQLAADNLPEQEQPTQSTHMHQSDAPNTATQEQEGAQDGVVLEPEPEDGLAAADTGTGRGRRLAVSRRARSLAGSSHSGEEAGKPPVPIASRWKPEPVHPQPSTLHRAASVSSARTSEGGVVVSGGRDAEQHHLSFTGHAKGPGAASEQRTATGQASAVPALGHSTASCCPAAQPAECSACPTEAVASKVHSGAADTENKLGHAAGSSKAHSGAERPSHSRGRLLHSSPHSRSPPPRAREHHSRSSSPQHAREGGHRRKHDHSSEQPRHSRHSTRDRSHSPRPRARHRSRSRSPGRRSQWQTHQRSRRSDSRNCSPVATRARHSRSRSPVARRARHSRSRSPVARRARHNRSRSPVARRACHSRSRSPVTRRARRSRSRSKSRDRSRQSSRQQRKEDRHVDKHSTGHVALAGRPRDGQGVHSPVRGSAGSDSNMSARIQSAAVMAAQGPSRPTSVGGLGDPRTLNSAPAPATVVARAVNAPGSGGDTTSQVPTPVVVVPVEAIAASIAAGASGRSAPEVTLQVQCPHTATAPPAAHSSEQAVSTAHLPGSEGAAEISGAPRARHTQAQAGNTSVAHTTDPGRSPHSGLPQEPQQQVSEATAAEHSIEPQSAETGQPVTGPATVAVTAPVGAAAEPVAEVQNDSKPSEPHSSQQTDSPQQPQNQPPQQVDTEHAAQASHSTCEDLSENGRGQGRGRGGRQQRGGRGAGRSLGPPPARSRPRASTAEARRPEPIHVAIEERVEADDSRLPALVPTAASDAQPSAVAQPAHNDSTQPAAAPGADHSAVEECPTEAPGVPVEVIAPPAATDLAEHTSQPPVPDLEAPAATVKEADTSSPPKPTSLFAGLRGGRSGRGRSVAPPQRVGTSRQQILQLCKPPAPPAPAAVVSGGRGRGRGARRGVQAGRAAHGAATPTNSDAPSTGKRGQSSAEAEPAEDVPPTKKARAGSGTTGSDAGGISADADKVDCATESPAQGEERRSQTSCQTQLAPASTAPSPVAPGAVPADGNETAGCALPVGRQQAEEATVEPEAGTSDVAAAEEPTAEPAAGEPTAEEPTDAAHLPARKKLKAVTKQDPAAQARVVPGTLPPPAACTRSGGLAAALAVAALQKASTPAGNNKVGPASGTSVGRRPGPSTPATAPRTRKPPLRNNSSGSSQALAQDAHTAPRSTGAARRRLQSSSTPEPRPMPSKPAGKPTALPNNSGTVMRAAQRRAGAKARAQPPATALRLPALHKLTCARLMALPDMHVAKRRVMMPGHKRKDTSGDVGPVAGGGGLGSGASDGPSSGRGAGNPLTSAAAALSNKGKSSSRSRASAVLGSSKPPADDVLLGAGAGAAGGAAVGSAVSDSTRWRNITRRAKTLKFGRSKIQGWGMFATEVIEADEFVIEYIGEMIRLSLANARERLYQALGLDDYMFRVDDQWVVDATRKGGPARFINHCCEPNCYTKIISIDGVKHIAIYSKRRIEPGEELNYDYKFEEETDPARKVPCNCGARNCRKWMC